MASLVSYWATFNMTYPKHDLTNMTGNWRGKQKTTLLKVLVNVVFKFDPFVFDRSKYFVKKIKWIKQKKFFVCMVAPIIFYMSKMLIVTWVGSQELLMKLTIVTNAPYPTCNIQRLKEIIHLIHVKKGRITYLSLVFVIRSMKTSSPFAIKMEIKYTHIDG